MKRLYLFAWLVFFISGLGSTSLVFAVGIPAVDCSRCHRPAIDAGKAKRYVHAPFLSGNCATCHVVGEQGAAKKNMPLKVVQQERLSQLSWLKGNQSFATEHWVLIPAEKLVGSLYYRAWDGRERSPLQPLALPALTTLEGKKPESRPPVITRVRAADVRRGISTTVTIRWQTDEFSDSEVLYGLNGMDSSSSDGRLTRNHEMILMGLDANREYRFQVASMDLFGNRSLSEVFRFSTEKTYLEQQERREYQGGEAEDIQLTSEAYRQGQNYLLIFKTDRPVSLSLGVERPTEPASKEVEEDSQVAAAGTGHPLLKSQLDTNNRVCYKCHSSFQGGYSHPVNVFPKAGMIIPDDYPLLPDGRISCMSCHSAHSSDLEYRLIKKRKSELCRGCHRDY